jgi:CRP/FNR family transcriptional regulator, cyclic AMP receptor protein
MERGTRNQLINTFFQTGRPQRTHRKEIILGWEEKLASIYFIQKGFVKSYSLSLDGEELIHDIYGPGEVFPLPWAYTGIQRVEYYEALDDALLFRIPLPRFQEFSQSSILTSNILARMVAEQLNTYSDRITNLEHKKPMQRLAYRLLSLASRFGHPEGNHIVIDGPFTHQLIADTINLARETVSRSIAFMEGAGLLEQKNRRIIIKDVAALHMKLDQAMDLESVTAEN